MRDGGLSRTGGEAPRACSAKIAATSSPAGWSRSPASSASAGLAVGSGQMLDGCAALAAVDLAAARAGLPGAALHVGLAPRGHRRLRRAGSTAFGIGPMPAGAAGGRPELPRGRRRAVPSPTPARGGGRRGTRDEEPRRRDGLGGRAAGPPGLRRGALPAELERAAPPHAATGAAASRCGAHGGGACAWAGDAGRCGERCAAPCGPRACRWTGRRRPSRYMRKHVVLCDVSGSMSRPRGHSRMFPHALTAGPAGREAFAFGTRLTRLTRALVGADPGPRAGRDRRADAGLGRGHPHRRVAAPLQRRPGGGAGSPVGRRW